MLLDRDSAELVAAAPVLLGQLAIRNRDTHVKAEVTQAMVELNSSVHQDVDELVDELRSLAVQTAAVAESLHLTLPFRT